MVILETERLILRPWAMEDAAELFQLAKDEHVGPPCGWSPHKDVEESKYVLSNILINDYTFAIILKENNKIIGDIGIMPVGVCRYCKNETQAEIGYWLGYEYWGNGYMPEACATMIEYGFKDLQLKELLCAHNTNNHNSEKVQKKAGFQYLYTDTFMSEKTGKEVCNIVNHILADEWGSGVIDDVGEIK